MKHKLLTVVLTLALTAGCLAGCGDSSGDTGSSAKQESSSVILSSATEEKNSNFNETGYPIVNEKVTLKLYTASNIDPDEVELIKWLEELTNVHIEWSTVPTESREERYNLMWASGVYPDGVVGGQASLPDLSTDLIKDGVVIPLNDLIEQYMPNFKEHAADYMSEITYPDGNIYEFPTITNYYYTDINQAVAINQNWLDNVGMKVPTTIDEFTAVLRAFKEQDANGNGDPKDEIPYSAIPRGWQGSISMITGAFGLPASKLPLVVDGTVVDPNCEEGFQEAVKYLRGLYLEGLIDQEIFTQDQNGYYAKCKEDPTIVGCSAVWRRGGSYGDAAAEANNYIPLAPLTGPDGDRGIAVAASNVKISSAMWITNACEYPEILARWVDTLYDPVISLFVGYGALNQGVFEAEEAGKYYKKTPEGYSSLAEFTASDHLQGLPRLDIFGKDLTVSAPGVTVSYSGIDKPGLDEVYVESGAMYHQFPGGKIFEIEELEELNLLKTDIQKYQEETICRWICGQGDVDDEWAEYIETLEEMGHDRYIEIYQTVYNRIVANAS